jgi:hypothetical protein
MEELNENFPDEIWIKIFTFLPPKQLLQLNYVSKDFQKFSNSDVIWKQLVDGQWRNKFTKFLKKNMPNTLKNKKEIYFYGEKDSKRTTITKEELTQMGWQFRFKQDETYSPFFPRYTEDGRYIHYGVGSSEWVWAFGEKNQSVIVNNFPDHVLSRTKDWVDF